MTSRKFILAVLTLLISSGLLWNGNLESGAWATVVSAVLLSYMTANVAQKATAPKRTDPDGPPWAGMGPPWRANKAP